MPSKYPARNLTQEEIDHCLLVMAAHGANAKRAHEELEATLGDKTPNVKTLYNWRTVTHAERYLDIVDGLDRVQRDRKLVQGFREITQRSQDAIASSLNRLEDNIDNLEPKDLSKTAKDLGILAGIASQNTLLYEGRPTAIIETRNPDWYEDQLKERLEALGFDVDADAEEIPDAELIRGEDGEGL